MNPHRILYAPNKHYGSAFIYRRENQTKPDCATIYSFPPHKHTTVARLAILLFYIQRTTTHKSVIHKFPRRLCERRVLSARYFMRSCACNQRLPPVCIYASVVARTSTPRLYTVPSHLCCVHHAAILYISHVSTVTNAHIVSLYSFPHHADVIYTHTHTHNYIHQIAPHPFTPLNRSCAACRRRAAAHCLSDAMVRGARYCGWLKIASATTIVRQMCGACARCFMSPI